MTGRSLAEISTIPLVQVKTVGELLNNDEAKARLAAVAAKHLTPEKLMRIVSNAIRVNPTLKKCEPTSLLGAMMTLSALGLEPNTPLGHAYLIPFKDNKKGVINVTLIIGYKGFIDLARRSGKVISIHADVVYDDDEVWSHEYGSNQHLRHRPGPRLGKKIGAYCYVKLDLGEGTTAEGHMYMSRAEIEHIRDTFSKDWQNRRKYNDTANSFWTKFESVMWTKTVVRAMANRGELPMSIDFMEALETDERDADYSAFALDPTQGLNEDEDGDLIEGEGAGADGKTDQKPAQVVDKPKEEAPAKEPDKAKGARTEAPARKPAQQQRQDVEDAQVVDDAKDGAADAGAEEEQGMTEERYKALKKKLYDHPVLGAICADFEDFGVDDTMGLARKKLIALREDADAKTLELLAAFDMHVEVRRAAEMARGN